MALPNYCFAQALFCAEYVQCKPLLVRGQYVDAEQFVKRVEKAKGILHSAPSDPENGDKKVMTYKIVDNPKTFTDPNDFKRIVAVVAHGKVAVQGLEQRLMAVP